MSVRARRPAAAVKAAPKAKVRARAVLRRPAAVAGEEDLAIKDRFKGGGFVEADKTPPDLLIQGTPIVVEGEYWGGKCKLCGLIQGLQVKGAGDSEITLSSRGNRSRRAPEVDFGKPWHLSSCPSVWEGMSQQGGFEWTGSRPASEAEVQRGRRRLGREPQREPRRAGANEERRSPSRRERESPKRQRGERRRSRKRRKRRRSRSQRVQPRRTRRRQQRRRTGS